MRLVRIIGKEEKIKEKRKRGRKERERNVYSLFK